MNHQRPHQLPTTEQPSGQRSSHTDETMMKRTALMQTAAMRTRSSSKSGNSNNSKVADSINPHSGAQIRLRAIAADKFDNTVTRLSKGRDVLAGPLYGRR